MIFTGNDVIDYSRFFSGNDEPPMFYHEYLDLKNKTFIPNDDFLLAEKIGIKTQTDGILYYFSYDSTQNRLIHNPLADKKLHSKFYAVCSPDFSADSSNCFSLFNEANILKARINASLWQSECGESVILTLIWGDKSTYKYAFDCVEKGAVCAVSHQGIKDEKIFMEGLEAAIDKIQMENICWLGNIPDYVSKFYDTARIVKMQPRGELLRFHVEMFFRYITYFINQDVFPRENFEIRKLYVKIFLCFSRNFHSFF